MKETTEEIEDDHSGNLSLHEGIHKSIGNCPFPKGTKKAGIIVNFDITTRSENTPQLVGRRMHFSMKKGRCHVELADAEALQNETAFRGEFIR